MTVSKEAATMWPTRRWWSLAIRFSEVSDKIRETKESIVMDGGTQDDLNRSPRLLRLELRESMLLKQMAADRRVQILKATEKQKSENQFSTTN